MALSDDQRALLRLLAKREEGYEDIAALKGLSVEQIRAEVQDALAGLESAAEIQAPPPPPPAVKTPEPEATPEISASQQPQKPDPDHAPPASQPPRRKARPGPTSSRPALPVERRRLVLLTGGALGVVAVVLIAIALLGGDSSDSGSDSAADSGTGAETAAVESDKVTQAVLEPADGSDAGGAAVFGRLGKDEIVLQVTVDGLEPTAEGEFYTVWLYRTPKLVLRVGKVPVGEAGRLGARFKIPPELLAYVASGAFDQIYVSRTSDAAYEREVAQAKKNKSLPRYTGETVLTGEITGPIAKR
jgi:hypothetical protein